MRHVFAVMIIWLAAVTAAGAELGDYRSRIDTARDAIDSLVSGRTPAERSGLVFTRVKELIPPRETIEWPGGEAETDNRWLHEWIDKQPDRGLLVAMLERLEAISLSMEELEAANSGSQSKDETKRRLAEILRRPEFQKPETEEGSRFQKWVDAFVQWLRDAFPSAPDPPPGVGDLGSIKLGLQVLVFLLIIGFVGFLLYRFGPAIAGRISSRTASREKSGRVILGEYVAADESSEDLFSEAERLAREGRLRDAIRKGYVATLCELGDRKVVKLARHKTNRDYVREVRKNAQLLDDLKDLTGHYEKNWYGLYDTGPSEWDDFRERFRRTISTARRAA